MPHRQLSAPVLIVGAILVKLCLRAKPVCGTIAEWGDQRQRNLLQSGMSNGLSEYDASLDDPLQLVALTAVYEATGGRYWTYAGRVSSSTGTSAAPSPSQALEQLMQQRFGKAAWMTMSVSYCQW